jgi:hypothetical protein
VPFSLTDSLSLSLSPFFFRQVSNLSTTKEHILWLVLIEWKKRVLLVIIKKHDTIDERRIIINKCREIERVNIYIWMEIIDWKCSNEMNQCVCIYIERDAAFVYMCATGNWHKSVPYIEHTRRLNCRRLYSIRIVLYKGVSKRHGMLHVNEIYNCYSYSSLFNQSKSKLLCVCVYIYIWESYFKSRFHQWG